MRKAFTSGASDTLKYVQIWLTVWICIVFLFEDRVFENLFRLLENHYNALDNMFLIKILFHITFQFFLDFYYFKKLLCGSETVPYRMIILRAVPKQKAFEKHSLFGKLNK